MKHFKDHAIEIIRDCNAGTQRCSECPFFECTDNDTSMTSELRRLKITSIMVDAYMEHDRRHAERARRKCHRRGSND